MGSEMCIRDREWTDEWYAGLGAAGAAVAWSNPKADGGGFYNSDSVLNVASSADDGIGYIPGLPAAANRGGSFNYAAGAGVFALNLGSAPSYQHGELGFRCVIQ